MTSVFDLPHVFIAFSPGAGGNFLAGLFKGLLEKEYSKLEIADSGSSHTTVLKKIQLNGDLSTGTFIDTSMNLDEKTNHYREVFAKLEITEPTVSWTHDFKNIALYRALFPNSKIVVVTQTTDEEKLAVTFMHVIKNILDDNVIADIPPEQFKIIKQVYKEKCVDMLKPTLTLEQIDKLFQNPANRDTLVFVYIKLMILYYDLAYLVEDTPKQNFPEVHFYGTSNQPYKVDQYLTDDCIISPYSAIMNGNVDKLLDVSKSVLSRDLTVDEKNFVIENYSKYRLKQNMDILTNPVQYYKNLSRKVRQKAII